MNKFNLLDDAFILLDHKVVKVIVMGITLSKSGHFIDSSKSTLSAAVDIFKSKIQRSGTIIYIVRSHDDQETERPERLVFKTKEDLIASL